MVKTAAATRCGFVALVGPPNVGKSTLLNRLVGGKVSIVTPKVQTTRTRIRGIGLHGNCQLIFVDTPGIFAPRRRLERAMVEVAWTAAADADAIVLLVDASQRLHEEVHNIVARLRTFDRPLLVVLNKIDRTPRPRLLTLADELRQRSKVDDILMITAEIGDGVDDLQQRLVEAMPEGVWLYPEDQLSDLPLRLTAAEISREKAFLHLHQELPYALTVETDQWQPFKDGSVRVEQTLYVRRDSQKAIVLGKGGSTIKRIRSSAQAELSQFLDQPVHLFINVKVRENWMDDPARYREWGLRYDA